VISNISKRPSRGDMILTIQQVAQYMHDNGPFRGEPVAYMSACAMAESGGDTDIEGVIALDGTRGFGLVQIETENVQGGEWTSPSWQASKAFAMSAQGTNFEPWCTACAPMPILGFRNGQHFNYSRGCEGAGSGNAIRFLGEAYEAAAHVLVAAPAIEVSQSWEGVILGNGVVGHGTGIWQARLNVLESAGLSPDGFFGPVTANATTKYQQNHKLNVTGHVYEADWNKAFAA
jgi:hypothetical protein